jgi:hypothetical protein
VSIWVLGLLIFTRFVLHEALVERIFSNRSGGASGSSNKSSAQSVSSADYSVGFFAGLFRRRASEHKEATEGNGADGVDGERPWKRTSLMLPVVTSSSTSGGLSPPNLSPLADIFSGDLSVPLLPLEAASAGSSTDTDVSLVAMKKPQNRKAHSHRDAV